MSTLSLSTISLRPAAELGAAAVGAACFYYLFWAQAPGLNLLTWTTLVLLASLLIHNNAWRNPKVIATAAGALFAGVCLVVNGNPIATKACIISLMACCGFVLETRLRSLLAPGILLLMQAVRVPVSAIENTFPYLPASVKRNSLLQFFQLAIVPVIFLCLFFMLFVIANSHFAEWVHGVDHLIESFFDWARPERIAFLGIGFVVTAALLWPQKSEWSVGFDLKANPVISRVRKPTWANYLNAGLRTEFRSGLLLLAGINLLLLLVNANDFSWIWLGREDTSEMQPYHLSHLVHFGTNILIFSILLSMAIMLWLFRDKMNFFSNNSLLKTGCYLWIVQNAFLVGTVALSNWRYIASYGLTYQRVGVYFFLVLALAGLLMLWLKIRGRKSFFWLLNRNSWAFYICLLLLGTVNWNYQISRFNLSLDNGNPPDLDYLISLAPESLPLMYAQREKLFPGSSEDRIYFGEQRFDEHITSFLSQWEEQDWQSWNRSGEKVYQYFTSGTNQ